MEFFDVLNFVLFVAYNAEIIIRAIESTKSLDL